jgi:hypothetical protein
MMFTLILIERYYSHSLAEHVLFSLNIIMLRVTFKI